jgi:hypothetical protein
MSDGRSDFYTRNRQCGRCGRVFDIGETAYVPGRYEAWTWSDLPLCWACCKVLEDEAARTKGQEGDDP